MVAFVWLESKSWKQSFGSAGGRTGIFFLVFPNARKPGITNRYCVLNTRRISAGGH